MNDFSSIDAVLFPWASKRGLHVYTGHRQNDVRFVVIYLWEGARHESTGHLWFDPPDAKGLVAIHAARRDFRYDWKVPVGGLEAGLDEAAERLEKDYRKEEAAESR